MSTVAVTNLKHESATGNNIILDSSGNAAFADGSASAPSITNDGDTNTGIYFPAADNIGFATNGVIRGRWTNDGLCFNADTAAANALDDYEEGTWTPTATGETTAGTTTYTTNTGGYVKIGQSVTVWFEISYSAMTGTGNMSIGGFPFTSVSGSAGQAAGAVMTNVLNWSGGSYLVLYKSANTTTASLFGSVDDGGWTNQQCVNENAGIIATVTYRTSS